MKNLLINNKQYTDSGLVGSKYKIIREIGHGGMASVYLGQDIKDGRNVAIKVLHSNFANGMVLKRFIQEAKLCQKINRKNIVKVYEHGPYNGTYFISMEYVPESLAEIISRKGKLKPQNALNIVLEILDALNYVYSRNLAKCHRDIKPQNILIGKDGQVKLIDFGIAKADLVSSIHTGFGKRMGTPQYMSPEQHQGYPSDIRSDIYSLGIVLYEMITGYRPFDAENEFAIARMQIHNNPAQILSDDGITNKCWKIIQKAMNKNPNERFQTPMEMIATLNQNPAIFTGTVDDVKKSNLIPTLIVSLVVLSFFVIIIGQTGSGTNLDVGSKELRQNTVETLLIKSLKLKLRMDENNNVKLSWTDPNDIRNNAYKAAVHYAIFRGTTTKNIKQIFLEKREKGTVKIDTFIDPNNIYYYEIHGVNEEYKIIKKYKSKIIAINTSSKPIKGMDPGVSVTQTGNSNIGGGATVQKKSSPR